jgi:glycosyltransferase involved in cell wall biosynthesis
MHVSQEGTTRPAPEPQLRVTVHDYIGHPNQLDLSRELARRGHQVLHILCNSASMPHGDISTPLPGLEIRSIPGPESFTSSRPSRRLREIVFALRASRAIRLHRSQLVLSGNAPPLVQLILSFRRGRPFLFWLQDLLNSPGADSSVATAFFNGKGIRSLRFDQLVERVALRRSAMVIAIASNFVTHVRAVGVAGERIQVTPNWGPQSLLSAIPTSWPPVDDLKAGGEPMLLYAGTLDSRHGPELLAELARRCHAAQTGVVVLTSNAAAADDVRNRLSQAERSRFRSFEFQDFAVVPDMLASADLLLVSLTDSAGEMSVPSKVLSYLCAGRPILGAVPASSGVAAILNDSGAGVITPPGSPELFADEALRLMRSESRSREMGAAGRRYAAANFDIDAVADTFEASFRSVLHKLPGAGIPPTPLHAESNQESVT